MTSALPPVTPQPAAPQSRDIAGMLGVDAAKKPRVARDAETARALRPVDGAGTASDPRLTTRRDQPIGPPPAFAINVLQHLRDTAFDPPEPTDDATADDIDSDTTAAPDTPANARGEQARRGEPGPYVSPTHQAPSQVDIKL